MLTPQIFQLTSEDAQIWGMLQPPELRASTVFGELPQQIFDDTQTAIAWIQSAWDSDPFQEEQYEATEELNQDIFNRCYTTDNYKDIGWETWAIWTSIWQLYQVVEVPQIDEAQTDWAAVGRFVVSLLQVALPEAETYG